MINGHGFPSGNALGTILKVVGGRSPAQPALNPKHQTVVFFFRDGLGIWGGLGGCREVKGGLGGFSV